MEHLSEAAAPVCLSPVSPNVSAAAPARKQRREVEFYKLQVIMVTMMALNITLTFVFIPKPCAFMRNP